MMPKVAIIDTYYPDFLKTFHVNAKSTYEAELRRLLGYQFGTFDAYSRNLRKLGWEAIDIIANCGPLQEMWQRQIGLGHTQMHHYKPDVVFLQDLSLANQLIYAKPRPLVAGQCSCPWPGDDLVRRCDIVFTSFPHYVPRIEKLGVRAVYNPLAFEPSVLEDQFVESEGAYPNREIRPHDCVFIGGVGTPSHWKRGMETLHRLAFDIPTMEFYGYGYALLPDIRLSNGQSANQIKAKYRGQAWGSDMYEILLRSKICLNRHGEVAEGYSNNMRMFEATGCGALLLTEDSKNIRDFFTENECVTYSSPQDAVDKIRYYLDHEDGREEIAANGQKRTLRDHTYEKRMKTVSDTLQEMLCVA